MKGFNWPCLRHFRIVTGWLKSGEEGNPIYADNGMVGNEKSNEEVDKVSVAEEEEEFK